VPGRNTAITCPHISCGGRRSTPVCLPCDCQYRERRAGTARATVPYRDAFVLTRRHRCRLAVTLRYAADDALGCWSGARDLSRIICAAILHSTLSLATRAVEHRARAATRCCDGLYNFIAIAHYTAPKTLRTFVCARPVPPPSCGAFACGILYRTTLGVHRTAIRAASTDAVPHHILLTTRVGAHRPPGPLYYLPVLPLPYMLCRLRTTCVTLPL